MTTKIKKIAIASDHGGFAMKEAIKKAYEGRVEWVDLGTCDETSCNYADFGFAAAEAVSKGEVERAIVICGSGIGISIAANRYAKVRAALCTDATMARLSRQHNDANILALGGRIIGLQVALDCVDAFLTTEFEGGRHNERIKKLNLGI